MITLTNLNFKKLIEMLSLIKDVCNDADIRQGQLRQIVNNKTFLVEADLSEFLGESDLVLPMLKNKLQLLRIFLEGGNDNDIIFDDNNGKYTFNDGVSQLRFTITDSSQYLDNKYMTTQDKDNVFILDDDTKYMDFTLDKYSLMKIKILTENLNVDDLIINIENNSAKVDIVSFNKLNDATIIKDISVDNISNEKYSISMSSGPYKLDFTDSVNVTVYKNMKNPDENRVITVLTTNLLDIDLTIYIPGFLNKVEIEQ